MTLARKTGVARSSIVSLVRDEIGDPATRANGSTIPAAGRRWLDAAIETAIEHQLIEMGNIRAQFQPHEALKPSADLTPGADGEVDIPAAIGIVSAPVYKVEEKVNGFYYSLDFVSPQEIDLYDTDYGEIYRGSRRWTIVAQDDDFTTTTLKLLLRPKTTASSTVRVWYLAPPIVPGDDADVHPQADRWIEYIVLGSAMRLLSRDGEATPLQMERYARQDALYKANSERYMGPTRVRRRRRGI